MARILGLSRFGGPMDVYLEKIGQAAPLVETEPMRWGKLLEPAIAAEYTEKTGRMTRRAKPFIRRRGAPQFYANLDRWSILKPTTRRVLELKTTSTFTADDFGEEYTDQVPGDYLAQSMWYCFVTDSDQADLAALIGGNRHRVYEVPRDDELVREMVEVAEKFWRDTEQRIPPPVDGSEAATEYLKRTYRDRGTEHEMTDELLVDVMTYAGLKEQEKALAADITTVGNRIRDTLGDDRWAEGEGVKVTYGEVQGARVTDWTKLVEMQKIDPAIVAAFTRQQPSYRQLRVTVKPA